MCATMTTIPKVHPIGVLFPRRSIQVALSLVM